jgi:hypothetical protein
MLFIHRVYSSWHLFIVFSQSIPVIRYLHRGCNVYAPDGILVLFAEINEFLSFLGRAVRGVKHDGF